jgi:hypothetical protein
MINFSFRDIWALTWPLIGMAVMLWKYRVRRESGLLFLAWGFAALFVAMLLVQLFFRK